MGRNLSYSSVTGLGVLDLSEVKMTTKLSFIEFLSELVNSLDVEVSSIGMDSAAREDFVIG